MGSALSNGSSGKWRRLREQVLRRDAYTCQQCGQTEGKLHVDHVIPRRLNGSDSMDNLQTLCQKCNLTKGGRFFSIPKTPPTLHGRISPENRSVSHE